MWVFTVLGYFSVIQHRDDKDLLLIRARMKGDLEKLQEKYLPNLGDIQATPTGADYPYRALAYKVDWANAISDMAMDIDYTNFKSEVSTRQGSPRHNLYMRVWSIMKGAEEYIRDELKPKVATVTSQKEWHWEGGKTIGFRTSEAEILALDKEILDLDKSRAARNARLAAHGSKKLSKKERRIEAEVERKLRGGKEDYNLDPEDWRPYSYGLDKDDLQDLTIFDPDEKPKGGK